MEKKYVIGFAVVALVLALFVVIKMSKPTVIINTGIFFPRDIIGLYQAAKVPVRAYDFKANIYNMYGFDIEAYKTDHPENVIIGRDGNAQLLTSDAADLILEVKNRYKWVRIELRGLKEELIGVYEIKYFGFI